ncbi:MAG: hypothetical protein SOZ34_05725 [Clostridia bacterium]|nr:hypothetical protein [Clostridia bacterium]
MKKQNALKKALGMVLSAAVVSAQLAIHVSAAGTVIQNNFTGGDLGNWKIGSQREGMGTLTAQENAYARLSLSAGQTIAAYNDKYDVTPDAKLELTEPFVLGENNDETVIRTRIKTDFVPNDNTPRVFFSINYTDDANDTTTANSENRYGYKYNALWALDKTKVYNYSHWNTQPSVVEAYNGLVTDTWYTIEAHMWSDATGISYVSVRVFDEDGVKLNTGEVTVNANNPLRSIKQINNIGIEMRGLDGSAVTAPNDGYNIDFDSFAIYHATDANSLVEDDSIPGKESTPTEPETPDTTTEPRKYTFTNGIIDWELGVSQAKQTLTAEEEAGNKFARLQANDPIWTNNTSNNTPDAKLTFEKPYLLGENTTTVITTKFRTNTPDTKALRALMINYDDSLKTTIYHGSKHNILWGQRENRFDIFPQYDEWGNCQAAQINFDGGATAGTWYIVETKLTTGAAGTISGICVAVKDLAGNTLGQQNTTALPTEHPLAKIKYIENLGLQMLAHNSTQADSGMQIDFDDFAIYNLDTVGTFSLVQDTFLETMSAFQIQLGAAPADDYELIVTNEDGEEIYYNADFDNTTNILTVTLDEVQGEGEYSIFFDNGYITKDAVVKVQGTTTENIVYDFESDLNGWNQRNSSTGETFAQVTEGGNSFARITIPQSRTYNNYYANSINTYPVVKVDLEKNYKFVPESVVVISTDIRTNDITSQAVRPAMKINNDLSDGGQWFNSLWRLDKANINNYSFSNSGTAGTGNWIKEYGWPEGIRPNQASSAHYGGYGISANTWYTVKIVYNIGDDGRIETSNYYLFDADGLLVDSMEKDNHIADSLKNTTYINRIGIEMIGQQNKALSADMTFDFDNISIKSYNKTDVINSSEVSQTAVKSNTDYYGKFTYFNNRSATENVNIQGLIAVYENVNGAYKLIGVKCTSKSVAPGADMAFATAALNSGSGTMIKSFLWDTTTQAPICKETKIGQ